MGGRLQLDLGTGIPVQVQPDLVAVADEDDVVPGPAPDLGRAGDGLGLALVVAVEEDQLAGAVGGPPDADMLAVGIEPVIATARVHPAGGLPTVGGHAVPEPEGDRIVISQVGNPRLQATAREMGRPVRLGLAAEGIGARSLQEEHHPRLVVGIATTAGRVDRPGSGEFVQPPVSHGPGPQDRVRGGAATLLIFAAVPAGDPLEQLERRLRDPRLGVHLQAGGAGRPGVVAAQAMLFGGRDVAVAAVGQLDHHRLRQGALQLHLQPGQRVGFIRRRGDRDVADPERLQDDLGRFPLVQDDLLARVDFLGGLRRAIAHRGDDASGPFQSLLIGDAILEHHPRLGHRQVGVGVMVDGVVGR